MDTMLWHCSLRAALMVAGTAAALGLLRVKSAAARHLI